MELFTLPLKDQFFFSFFRRHQLAKRVSGFSASARSYASKNCAFEGFNRLSGKSHLANTTLGLMSYVSSARISNAKIGRFCSIGFEAIIGLGSHPSRYLSTHPAFYSVGGQSGLSFVSATTFSEYEKIAIGNDVWVGARAIILGGVAIGDGAIIAARTVVAEDVPPFAIVGGVPARVIRYRFPDDVRAELLNWKWWDISLENIRAVAEGFSSQTKLSIDVIRKLRERQGAG
jgi:acetyltransferase-like isoleucine patch superfamily enzyme